MFDYLQIDARRERWLVGSADLALAPIGAMGRWRRPPPAVGPPRRILLFRLERIGDLLMTREAIAAVRVRAPQAEIHLVVGSWNEDLARLGSQADRVETLDAPWLSREGTRSPLRAVGAHAARWRRDGVDLAINFEPDIRSNALIAASGARRRVGWSTGGGATFLTDALPYDPTAHTADNMQRLVERALPEVPGARPPEHGERLEVSADAAARARQLLPGHEVSGPLIGVNPGCGRAIKQWPVDRFAEAATTLARTERATLVFLGSHAETPITDAVQRALPDDVHSIDLVGLPVPDLAAVLAKLSGWSSATPARCTLPRPSTHRWWPSSVRPIRPGTHPATNTRASCTPTSGVDRATGFADRRLDVPTECPIVSPASPSSRWCRRHVVSCAVNPESATRRTAP